VGNSCSSPKPVWYPDNDGDGYGDENAASKGVTVSSCTLPPPNAMVSKFVLDHSDCCDADPIANPGYLAAHAGNPWMLAPDACGDYLWNCEPNKVPVVEFPPLPLCSTTWQTCINNSQTNPTCATDGCASLCIGTPPQCTDIGSGTAACGFSILANYYQCNLDSTGTMCSAGIGNSIYGVQGCY